MKKVLIITYYWPPAGGGGVMRWLKMTPYIYHSREWEPIIYCPKGAGYLVVDQSLNESIPKEIEVIQEPILEPNNFLSKLGFHALKKSVASGGVGTRDGQRSFKNKLVLWIRSNLFIPDARFLWVKLSTKRLEKQIKQRGIDTIITTGPPHSMHLIGLNIKKKCDVKWVADFRDPWTFIDFYEQLDLTNWARRKHERLEREVIEGADKLVTVSRTWGKQFEKLYGKEFKIINNGFDPKDFEEDFRTKIDPTNFIITHIGSLNSDRNPQLFWKILGEICSENPEFKEKLRVKLIGNITGDIEFQIKENKLQNQVELIEHLAHKEVIGRIKETTLSLLLINNTSNQGGIIPGKLYEYLAAQRPILCIGNKEGDSAQIINETKAGELVDFEDYQGLKEVILNFYSRFINGELALFEAKNIEKYSRKNLAYSYMRLLDELLKK